MLNILIIKYCVWKPLEAFIHYEVIYMKKMIGSIILALLLLSGCSEDEPKENTYQSHEQPMAEFEEVYTLGLYEEDAFENERTFKINQDSFRKSVVLGNKTSKDSSFILLVFNHGEQVDFKLPDGKIYSNHSFDIESGEYMDLEVSLVDLEDGFHSITYILMQNPGKLPSDYETAVALADVYSIRINLFKNIDNIPDERPSLFTEALISEERRVHGVFLGKRDQLYDALFKEEVADSGFPYTLLYGNSNSEPLDFYIVGLLNFKQTPLGNHSYIYDTLEPGEEKSFPIEFNGTLKEINNSFQVLMIPTPFTPVTQQNPFLLQDPLASNRMLLLKK